MVAPSPERVVFQSTPLIRGETTVRKAIKSLIDISIHSPHTRGDRGWPDRHGKRGFQSTPLIRGETHTYVTRAILSDFNPLPSYEGRRAGAQLFFAPLTISIHSPHTRGDTQALQPEPSTGRISIHSPHTRGDATAQAGRH